MVLVHRLLKPATELGELVMAVFQRKVFATSVLCSLAARNKL